MMQRANTSASNLFRRDLCPGSARMEHGLAEVDSEHSLEGNLLHALYWTGQRPQDLTPDQRDCLDDADRYTRDFFAKVCTSIGIPEDEPCIDEKEVPLVFRGQDGSELFPGHS